MSPTDITQAVIEAAAANDVVAVNNLLEGWKSTTKASPSPESTTPSFQTALYEALRAGRVEMARTLLDHGCVLDPGECARCCRIFFFFRVDPSDGPQMRPSPCGAARIPKYTVCSSNTAGIPTSTLAMSATR